MSVSLGGVALADGLLLTGADAESGLRMSVRQTFGAPVAQRCQATGGITMALVAEKDGSTIRGGVFTTAQKNELIVLRDAGEIVELIHPLGRWWVLIPIDGIQLTSFYKKQTPAPDDPQVGTVTVTTMGVKNV